MNHQFRDEVMGLSQLTVDFELNPREKSQSTIDEFVDVMQGYKAKALTFDECWHQRIEATEDGFVTKGSHSLLAALQVYGGQHQVTVRVHNGVSGREKAAFLSATSNVHGKPYKPGERKKCIFQVLEVTQNLKSDNDPDKEAFLSLRDIAALTGISKGYVYELRRDFRAENGLPTDKGEFFTVEELAATREKERGKTPKIEETVVSQEDSELTKEEVDAMSDEELMAKMEEKYQNNQEDNSEQSSKNASDGDPLEQPVSENSEDDEEGEEQYYSDLPEDGPPEEYLKNAEPDAVGNSTPGVNLSDEIGNTDIVTVPSEALAKQINSERNEIVRGTKSLMDDFLKLDDIEATEALENFRGEVVFIRDDKGLWNPDVDPECNGKDIVSSILLNFLDRLEVEHKEYSKTLAEFPVTEVE